MCVIIDASVRDLVFSPEPKPAARQIIDWIERDEGRVAYGGTKLCDELFGSAHASRRLRAWKQAGRALQYRSDIVDAVELQLGRLGTAKSNDTHVLALAQVSGARTLYSTDEDLHEDFKNSELLNGPRGCVYQVEGHRDLLTHTSSCKTARNRDGLLLS